MRILVLFFLLCPVFAAAQDAADSSAQAEKRLQSTVDAFVQAYGSLFDGLGKNAAGATVLRIAGKEFLYDDGKLKDFETLLDDPDIEDTMTQVYPLTAMTKELAENFDPGRFRVEKMFMALYGETEALVRANCVSVKFCGHTVLFNRQCGAADALAAVGQELDALFVRKPELREYVRVLAGTMEWRFIAGTRRLSGHSFGTAIDLNVKKSAYWMWDAAHRRPATSRLWPLEIVETFERHGFVWGGKWWHYDTMHFEYRPELLAYARLMQR